MSALPILSSQTPNSGKVAAGQPAAPAEDIANGASPFGEFLAKHLSVQDSEGIKADVLKKLVADSDPQAADMMLTASATPADGLPTSDLLASLLPQDKLAALAATANVPANVTATSGLTTEPEVSDASTAPLQVSLTEKKEMRAAPDIPASRDAAHEKLPAAASGTAFAAALQAQDKTALRTPTPLNETAQSALQATASAPSSTGIVSTLNPAAPIHASAPAQAAIPTPVGQPQWANDFSQKVTWLATQRTQSAELHLNPAQLGPLEISLKLNGDQATLQFTSAHAAVRDAIEQSLPRLRDMLAESGISLGNTTVSDQAPREQQQREKTAGMNGQPAVGAPPDDAAAQAPVTTLLRRHDGVVDTFA